jgi:ribosomal protein S18 acetylase RimI-like enzyme
MRIRPAQTTDETDVVALWRDCGLAVSYNDPVADFRFALGKNNSDVLVGIDSSNTLIASVMVGHDGHRGWLYYVAVAQAVQRNGIGRLMTEAAETWLSERGVRKVQLMIRETNTQIASFYERSGFKTIPRTVMEKWLKPSD